MSAERVSVVWDDRFLAYDFGAGHPFTEASRGLAVRLIETVLGPAPGGALAWVREVPPVETSALLGFHEPAYVARVRAAGDARDRRPLDAGDTPSFPGCFEAAARVVGGTVRAARDVLANGRAAFAPAGGLHHAHPGRASGFCIFNDLAVALAEALAAGHRTAYVDLDAHHGDGVMYGFYGNGRLLDIDFHQDGRTLFPGTGRTAEAGTGDGAGLKVNVPLPPRAGDDALLPLARRLLPPLLRDFRPELLVVQHGVDGHWGDPLARLQYSPAGYAEVDRLLFGLAGEQGSSLLVTGGGGYDAANVARTLARTGLLLAGAPLPAATEALPGAWRREFARRTGVEPPSSWAEPPRLETSSWSRAREDRLVGELEEALGRRFPPP